MGTKIDEGYVDLFPKINLAKTRAELARMSGVLTSSFGAMEKRIGQSMTAAGNTVHRAFTRMFAARPAAQIHGVYMAAERLSHGMNSLGKGVQTAGRGMTRFSQGIGIAAFQTQILGYALTTFVSGPLSALATMGVKAGVQFAMGIENSSVALQALLPKGANVVKLMKDLQQLAIKSPVWEIGPLTKYTSQLVASGLETKRIMPLMTGLSNIFMTLGVAPEQASQALFALTQMMSKGKVTGEELNRQWANAIPGGLRIFAEAARKLGYKSLQDMTAATQSGKLSMNKLMGAITEVGMSGKYLKGAATATGTLSAQWASLKETVTATIGNKFLEEKDGRFTFKPEVAASIEKIKNALITIINAVDWDYLIQKFADLAQKVSDLVKQFDEMSDEKKEKILGYFKALMVAGPVAIVLGYLLTTLSNVVSLTGAAAQGFGLVAQSLGKLGPAGLIIGGVALAVIGLAAAMAFLVLKTEEGKQLWAGFSGEMKRGWESDIKPALDGLWKAIKQDLAPAATELIQALGFDDWKQFGSFMGGTLVVQITNTIRIFTGLIKVVAWGIGVVKTWWEIQKAAWHWVRDVFGPGLMRIWTIVSEWFKNRLDWMFRIFLNTIEGIKTLWSQGTGRIKLIWDITVRTLAGAWDAFRSHVARVIAILKKMWEDFTRGVTTVAGRMRDGVISIFWGIIRGATDALNGLIGLLNKAIGVINKILPGKDLDPIPPIGGVPTPNVSLGTNRAAQNARRGLATGGFVTGPGTETSDSIPAMLSAGEYVIRAKAVRSLGQPTMDYINKHGEVPQYATGGFVQNPRGYSPGMGRAVPGGVSSIIRLYQAMGGRNGATSTYRPGDPLWHGSGLAVDFGGFNQDAVAQRLMSVRGGLLELIHSTNRANYGVSRGREHNMGGQLWAEHKNHLHLAATPEDVAAILGGRVPLAGNGGGFNLLATLVRKALDATLGKAWNAILPSATEFPSYAIRNIMEVAKKRLYDKFLGMAGSSGSGGPGQLGAWIQEAMKYVTIEWPEGLRTLIMRESGGNPRAVNNWDSNAAAGTPSKGLMQTIQPTFDRYRDKRLPNDIFHPIANIVAGMNYIHARYGSLRNVPQAHADQSPRGYDNGGLLPHGQLGLNTSGKPEMVLSHAQGKALEQRIAGSGGCNCEHHLYIDGRAVEVVAERVVEKKNRDLLRRVVAR